jgi:glycosyltransferase involved in cell wall biosynthesis
MGVPCLESDLEYYLPAGGFIRCASDGSDLADVLDAAESDPDWEAQRVATRDRVVREHSWERRGREIYDNLVGIA